MCIILFKIDISYVQELNTTVVSNPQNGKNNMSYKFKKSPTNFLFHPSYHMQYEPFPVSVLWLVVLSTLWVWALHLYNGIFNVFTPIAFLIV